MLFDFDSFFDKAGLQTPEERLAVLKQLQSSAEEERAFREMQCIRLIDRFEHAEAERLSECAEAWEEIKDLDRHDCYACPN